MINLVLSFDDGLLDFKEFALPILRKHGFKATINVISGFSDKTIQTSYKYLDKNDVVELYNDGFEIANHTNSHMKYASYDELDQCNKKINQWCNSSTVLGIAMPKYAKPSQSAEEFINKFSPPYITYEVSKFPFFLNIFRRIIFKIKLLLRKTTLNQYRYTNQIKMYKKYSKFFYRIEVGAKTNPILLYESLKSVKNNHCLTLCFHSVSDDPNSSDYPKGAWTPESFDRFLNLVKNDKRIRIITQIEACMPTIRGV